MGAMGRNPPYGASPRLVFPPQGGLATHWVSGAAACSSCPKGATLWGVFPLVVIHPQMAPLILGLLGFAGSIH